MLQANDSFITMLNAPMRSLRGRVEIYSGSTLASICGCHDKLESFTVERVGANGKFFGFGISQKLTASFIDRERELQLTTDNTLEVEFGVDVSYIYPCPNFYVTDVKRDETTSKITVTAQDALYKAAAHTQAELELQMPYTIKQVASACARVLGLPLAEPNLDVFNISYTEGANFDGTEDLRSVLDAIAEATQTIYYINNEWQLVFKRLDKDGEQVFTIDKSKYRELELGNECILSDLTMSNELGDNVTATTGAVGKEQAIKDNPFYSHQWRYEMLNAAIADVGGLTIIPFSCDWRGNFLLELGDKIGLTTKDDKTALSYNLDDAISFNGGMSAKTQWAYTEAQKTEATNPSTLGEALKQTFARVDKVEKKIELVVSESDANSSTITSLQLDNDTIKATITTLEEAKSKAEGDISTLQSQVSTQLTQEDIKLTIQSELSNGVSSVVTGKDFTFNDEGLHIADLNENNKNIATTISNNGMVVSADNKEKLKANDEGVKAEDLHATTYLIIGTNSRFENFNRNGKKRTACFWIGG